ncbi:hypothetical protein D3C71_560730 [compost metagenome]
MLECDKARAGQTAARQAGRHDRHPQPLRHQRRDAQPVAHFVTDLGPEAGRHAHGQHRFVIAGRSRAGEEHEVVRRQFRQAQRPPVRQRMRLRQARDEGFRHQVARLDLVRHRIGVDEAQILLAAPHRLDLLMRVQLRQHMLHIRQFGPHGIQQRRQAPVQHGPDKPDAQPAAQARVHPLHQRAHLFGLAQQGQGFPVQHLPGVGQLDVAAGARQQARAHVFLQLPDGVAERRLRNMQARRRPAEMALFRHRDEVAQQARIQVQSSLLHDLYFFWIVLHQKSICVD